MNCSHKRIQKNIKKNFEGNTIGYVYCCIDCKEIWEFYGLESNKDLDKNVVDTVDLKFIDKYYKYYYQYTKVIYAIVADLAEVLRKSLDGELKPQIEEKEESENEEAKETVKELMARGIFKPVAKTRNVD